jgi:alpha-L-rhamnosidase
MSKKIFILTVLLYCISIVLFANNDSKIIDMQVERQQNPIGIETEKVRFAWKIRTNESNNKQVSYFISVSKAEKDFDKNIVWKSGKIDSDKQFDVQYQGEKLESNTAYFWRVVVKTSKGKQLSSAISKFHIGLLKQEEWVAKWIISGDSSTRAPYFRKTFSAKKHIKSAYAYVTGQGYFVFFANGKRIGNEILAPAPSQYERRIYYSVFDLTNIVQKGSNALGLLLGEGQSASTKQKPERFHNVARIYPGKIPQPMGIVQLMIEYVDGTKETIITDESWKWSAGPITYNAFYGGEDYDARLELKNWNTAKYNDKKWKLCLTTNFKCLLSNSYFPPIRVVDEIKPMVAIKSNDSVYLYDLGQNIGGWWKLKITGKRGSVVEITGAETLNNQDFPKKLEQGDVISTIYSHGLGGFYERDAKSIYTLKGGAEETYEPNFFYSGFRYIQVKLKNPNNISSHSITACTTHSDMALLGSFECSDPVLNQLHKNTIWSIKGIAQGAPMSNPNSEKYGWTGDAHLFAEPTNLLFNSQNFWEKWLDDIRDAQLQYNSGNVVSTIPNYRRDITTTSPTWGAAYPLCTWYNYVFYADTALLEKQYDGLQAWCKHLDSRAKNHLVPGVWADHVPPGFLDGKMIQRGMSKESAELVASVYYSVAHSTMSKIATILGRKNDVLFHTKQVDAIKNAINKKYFDEDKKCYVVPPAPDGYFAEQTANLLPLQYNIVPAEHRKEVLNFVIEDLKRHKNHLTTGIMGTKALVDVLPEEGFAELFYEVATQKTYPGWGFWVEKGATTHWQHWSGYPDHNHAMFGSIENFIISNVGGIRIPSENENSIGYKMVNIKPLLMHKLTYAKTTVPSAYGMITCNWKREGLNVTMEIEIPTGSSGNVILPNSISEIRINGVEKAVQTNYAISSGKFILNFKYENL